MDARARDVLDFWLGDPEADWQSRASRWFSKDRALDEEIASRFGDDIERAARGELSSWTEGPPDEAARGALAFVILLDQLSRNCFRDTRRAFAQDAAALRACLDARATGLDRRLSIMERYMLYMPLMHAEDREIQELSVAAFAALRDEARADGAPEAVQKLSNAALDYAERHAAIVDRFGRYPHRNLILDRTSSPEEVEFLQQPGSSF